MIMKSGYYKSNMSREMSYKSFYPTPLQEIQLTELDYRTVELLSKLKFK